MSDLKLEVGKTYVFKDEEARQGYIKESPFNDIREKKHYKKGFTLDFISKYGEGVIADACVINKVELQYFKLKEAPLKEAPHEEESLDEAPIPDNLLQQLLTRIEALEQQLKEIISSTTGDSSLHETNIPLGQVIKSFNTHSAYPIEIEKSTLGEVTEAINYLSDNVGGVYNIYYLALFPEADGSYSGSIFQSMSGSDQSDCLWASFNEIII